MVGNYAFLEIELEHHDLQRILAYGEGQKIILSSVEVNCSYMTTRSPMEISLVDYFSHGSRTKFGLTFNDYSRCKLPLDNTHSSKLNLVSQNKGMISKVRCILPMVISSDFQMGQHRDGDHREDVSHFTFNLCLSRF